MCPSVDTSIHHLNSQSVNPSVCHSTSPSVEIFINTSIHHDTSLSIDTSIHHHTSLPINLSVSHLSSPSFDPHTTSLSVDPPDHLYKIFTSPSGHPSPSDDLYNHSTSPSDCLSLSNHMYATMTHLSACPLSNMTKCSHDSSQSLAVMHGSNPARPRNSVGSFLTKTYFYALLMYLTSIQVLLNI